MKNKFLLLLCVTITLSLLISCVNSSENTNSTESSSASGEASEASENDISIEDVSAEESSIEYSDESYEEQASEDTSEEKSEDISEESDEEETLLDYSNNGFHIKLPRGFIAVPDELRNGLTAEFGRVMSDRKTVVTFALKEQFSAGDGFESVSLDEYTALASENSPNSGPVEEGNGYFYYSYYNISEGIEFGYFACAYKVKDAFWLVQFGANKEIFGEYLPQFKKWCETVHFDEGEILKSNPKEFSKSGMSITLTDRFSEASSQFTAHYTSLTANVFILKEDYQTYEPLRDMTTEEYLQLIASNQGQESEIYKEDGLSYIILNNPSVNGMMFKLRVYAFKTEDALWMVQFVIRESIFDYMRDYITQWAKTVEIQ